ncbi:hypothetical protein [Alkalihalobacillus sp. AL-G]|uniref:hypothetical protein n=1 Tax=Alkalihalobacillus sp. AL-G TaxID=2926399 RepID=UPI002729BFA1|nr:hypothetical protein [Alkalihalobacillus sp. AL-G]WLD94358.1 hypothetical protein MOJ78_05575 [Alkalihalobacillus sp. AL-G]
MLLKSQKTGNVLKVFLWATVILTGICTINAAIYTFNYEVYLKIERFDMFTNLFFVITYFMLVIAYTIWIFKVHRDILLLNPSYEITPWGAIRRIFIPFYSIYGMWNLYSTMYRYFKESQNTYSFGSKLKLYLPFYYFLFFISNSVNRLVTDPDYGTTLFNDSYDVALLISYGLDLVLFISFLLIAKVVTKALNTIATEVNLESVDEGTNETEEVNDTAQINGF